MGRKRVPRETQDLLRRGDPDELRPLIARILAGEEPNKVFGWGARRGRPGGKFFERDWRIAVAICKRQDEETLEAARAAVAKEFETSEGTVKRAWERYHLTAQYLMGTRRPAPVKVTRADGTEYELDIGVQFTPPMKF